MATLIRFGQKGLNLDHVVTWEDDPEVETLLIEFLTPRAVDHESTGTVTVHYHGAERQQLVHFFQTSPLIHVLD